MKQVPFDKDQIEAIRSRLGIDIPQASIREMNALVNDIEQAFDTRFIRMGFGIPGLPANPIAAKAEAAVLEQGIANSYSPFQGVQDLKEAGSDFVKAFMDLDIPASNIVPTVGAMQGCFVSLGLAGYHMEGRDTILFLDPGFPVNKMVSRPSM